MIRYVRQVFILTLICFLTQCGFGPKEINLRDFEKKVYSEHGEDGVLEKIFELVGVDSKFFVEFGVQDGTECNTRYFREQHGFKGLLMDLGYDNPSINLKQEYITAENINLLLEKHHVPENFDLLSIDIDSNDFYVWHAMKHRPRVVVIEYNPNHAPNEDKVIVYDAKQAWDGTSYFGASLLAMYKLGRLKGYSLVYAETGRCNLFFLRDDILAKSGAKFKNVNNPQKLFQKGYHHPDPLERKYITSKEALKTFKQQARLGSQHKLVEYPESKPFYPGEGIASGNSAFNGAPEMGQFFAEIQKKYPITTVVETGTYHGGSTAFFAKMFKNVHTIDSSEPFLQKAKQNLSMLSNIQFHLGSSEKVLPTLLPALKDQFVLFFLDAHWGKYWPLLDELEEIGKTHRGKCIIVIDDVKVPGRGDIPFDKYKKKVCSFDYAKEKIEKIFDGYTVHYLIPANVQSRAKLVIMPKETP